MYKFKRPLLVIGIAGIILSAIIIFFPNDAKPIRPSELKADSRFPLRLKIPKINVDAAIESVGLTPENEMDVPKSPSTVAWFNLGPNPGEEGTAVMAGHYGWKDEIPAVFDDLYKLRKGDKVYVENNKGIITAFVVRKIMVYGKEEDASDVFSSNDAKAHLNLITCTGPWNDIEKGRDNRLVIFTDKETE